MRVTLGALAKSGLESHGGSDLTGAVNAALACYVGRLGTSQPPPPFPRFSPMQGKRKRDRVVSMASFMGARSVPEIDVDVDERVEAALREDARNQGVGLSELAGHAVLVYVAELDLIAGPAADQAMAAEGVIVPLADVDDPAPL